MGIFKKKKSTLDQQIENLSAAMDLVSPDSGEFKDMAETMDTLCEAKSREMANRKRVDPNVLIAGGFGIAQVLLVLHHEYLHPITSKAFSMIFRSNPKV